MNPEELGWFLTLCSFDFFLHPDLKIEIFLKNGGTE